MSDKYDEAIAYLTEHPDEIFSCWLSPKKRYAQGGCLFQFVTPEGTKGLTNDNGHFFHCGCLTTVRRYKAIAFSAALTDAILADERIPLRALDVRVEDLPVFAEWQRRLDKEIRSEVTS